MAMFRYEVMDKAGKVLTGAMAASDELQVRQKLTSMGYTVRLIVGPPVDAAPKQPPAPKAAPAPARQVRGNTVPPGEVIAFLQQLQSLLQSGFGMFDALVRIGSQTRNPAMCSIVRTIGSRVQYGESLSEAMSEFPRVFPPHVAGVVAAGELGGFVPAVLGEIVLDYEIEQQAFVRWTQWLTKLMWMNAIGIAFLVPVMPLLTVMFEKGAGVGDEVMIWSAVRAFLSAYFAVVVKYLIPLLGLGLIGVYSTRSALRRPQSRLTADRLALRTPVLGRASRDRSLANFTRMLWRLQSSGILPIQAWDAASHAANNYVVSEKLRGQVGALRSGARISQVMAATGLFRDEDQSAMEVAETAGQTADALRRMAMQYGGLAVQSAGQVRGARLRVAVIANIIALGAMAISVAVYLRNLIPTVERFFEPM